MQCLIIFDINMCESAILVKNQINQVTLVEVATVSVRNISSSFRQKMAHTVIFILLNLHFKFIN